MCIKIYKNIYIYKHKNVKIYRNMCKNIFISNYKRVYKKQSIKMCKMCIDVLICIQKSMVCIFSSIDLLYLIKTSWCHWIIFLKENLILLICPFCLNIRLSNCLQLQERSSILLVALEILRNSAPVLPQNNLLEILEQ